MKMRNGVTLIELIFAMVIIAIVFSVVPKIIFASNKSMQLSIKEDGLFDAVTLTYMISKLPWDKNTIESGGKILIVDNAYECNSTTGYRIGGFKGSRNCLKTVMTPDDTPSLDYSDIDDYDGYSQTTEGGRVAYDLNVSVTRKSDSDVKEIVTTVSSTSKKLGGGFQSSFRYDSVNLGEIQINKRQWQ